MTFTDWHNRHVNYEDLVLMPNPHPANYIEIARYSHPRLSGLEFVLEYAQQGCQVGNFRVIGRNAGPLVHVQCNNREREAFKEYFNTNTGNLTRLNELLERTP